MNHLFLDAYYPLYCMQFAKQFIIHDERAKLRNYAFEHYLGKGTV